MKKSAKSNCKFEQLVALYVEEDLSADDRSRVEAHLRECSDCWDLAEDLKESQSVFKSIREDVPGAAELSALRERVLSGVKNARPAWWFPRLVFASVALAMIGVGAWELSPPSPSRHGEGAGVVRNSETPRQTVATSLVPSAHGLSGLAAPSQEEGTAVRKSVSRAIVPKHDLPVASEDVKQVAIKFLTDDPNIIIYWLVDEKGE